MPGRAGGGRGHERSHLGHMVMGAEKILLRVADREVKGSLVECIGESYELLADGALAQPFDLLIVDTAGLTDLGAELHERRVAEQPAFLPVALILPREELEAHAGLLERVDDVLLTPLGPLELRLRVATLLRARQLSLDLKQRNEDLQSFIHAMTHDLRAPLTAVMGFSGVLLESREDSLDEETRRYISSIRMAGEQMGGLIAALIEFSRLGRQEIPMGPVPLQPLVYNCTQILQQQIKEHGARVLAADDLPVLFGNQALLQMTLVNLISNAVKYVPQGATPEVKVRSHPTGSGFRIEVTDNGIGISEANQQRLFTPFVRLKSSDQYPGIGLGLATVRKSIEIMGGRLGVVSAPGEGSTFWFELPGAVVGH